MRIGGEGTPEVSELCFAELAIARHAGAIAAENEVAAILDLKYRMPRLWQAVLDLRIEGWVARKVAKDARPLSKDRVQLVDRAVSEAAEESPGRLLAIAEAKIIEADPDRHRAKVEEDAKRTGVWLSKVRPGETVDPLSGEPATRRIGAKLSAGAAIRSAETIEDLATAIGEHVEPDDDGERPTFDQCKVLAFELLTSDPHKAAAFLDELDAPISTADQTSEADVPEAEQPPPVRKPKRRPAAIVVHLTDRVLVGAEDGVARVEGMGPVLLDQIAELVGDREINVQPVIDLGITRSVNGYEHPTAVRQRTLLRTLGDVFPHSTSRGLARLDHDHATPYDPEGPPGQTGDHNDAPLTRKHHRAKTHCGYRVDQLGLGAYRWITPHGLARVVTPRGTRKVDLLRDERGQPIGELYAGPAIDLSGFDSG